MVRSSIALILALLAGCRAEAPECGAAAAATLISRIASDQVAAADGVDSVSVQLTLERQPSAVSGTDPIEGAPVEWRAPAGCTFDNARTTTDDRGSTAVRLSCNVVGLQTYTASVCGKDISDSATFLKPTWHAPSSGIDSAVFTQVVSGRASPDVVHAVGSGFLYRSENKGIDWSRSPPAPVSIESLAVTPTEELIAVGAGLVFRSADAGATWLPASAGTDGAVQRVVSGPDGTLWASSATGALFVSHDAGASWAPLGVAPAAVIESSAVDPGVLFAYGTAAILYVSRDGGASFTGVTLSLVLDNVAAVAPDPMASSSALALVGRPLPSESFLGLATTVFETTDQGTTWSPVSLPSEFLPGRVTAASRQAGVIYAGTLNQKGQMGTKTTRDIIRSDDGGRTWQSVGAGNRTIVSLAVHSTEPDVAYAVTERGQLLRTNTGGR